MMPRHEHATVHRPARRPECHLGRFRAGPVAVHRRAARLARDPPRRPAQPVLDRPAVRAGPDLPDPGALLGAEIALHERRLAEERAVHTLLLHRRPGAVLRRGAQRRPGAVRRPRGGVPGRHRLLHGRARPPRPLVRDEAGHEHQPGHLVLQHQRADPVAARGRYRGGDPGAATTTAVGCGDLRALADPARHRDGQLGLPGDRVRRDRPLPLGAPPAGVGRDLPRARRGGEAVAAVHPRAAARARVTQRPDQTVRRRRAGHGHHLGGGQLPGLVLASRGLAAVLPAQLDAAGGLGHALVHRAVSGRQVEERIDR